MRSLLELSSSDNQALDCADWAEIATLFKNDRAISEDDLARQLHRDGFSSQTDSNQLASEAFDELQNRSDCLSHTSVVSASYPFDLTAGGNVIHLAREPNTTSTDGILYLFLLAITRASMHASSRTLVGIDPTKVFEQLCADVLLSFWGGKSAYSDVFLTGTAQTSGKRHFPSIVTALCKNLGQGLGWKTGAKSPGAGDGGLDVAVWRRFQDGRAGGLVGFAQCKTGDNWTEHLGRKNPASFHNAYMARPLVIDPLHLFMVPCRVEASAWDDYSREARGVLLDRCRIVHYGFSVSQVILEECRKWFLEAIRIERLQSPQAQIKKRARSTKRHP